MKKIAAGIATGAAVLGVVWLLGARQEHPDITSDMDVLGMESLVGSGAGSVNAPQTPTDVAARKKALAEGVQMYGYVDSWPENGEEVFAIGFDSKRYPYTDMRTLRRLVQYAENLMLENGDGTLKLLVYPMDRKYGEGADLLISTTVGKPSKILSSGVFPWLEIAASHPVKPDDVAKAVADLSGRKLKELIGKNLLITMPVTEFYQTESDEWVVISSTAAAGTKPFPIPLRIQPDDPQIGIIKPDSKASFSVILLLDEKQGRVSAYGRVAALEDKPIPDGVPVTELRDRPGESEGGVHEAPAAGEAGKGEKP